LGEGGGGPGGDDDDVTEGFEVTVDNGNGRKDGRMVILV